MVFDVSLLVHFNYPPRTRVLTDIRHTIRYLVEEPQLVKQWIVWNSIYSNYFRLLGGGP